MAAIATELELEMHSMDVKTAFLNGILDSEVELYMEVPAGMHAHTCVIAGKKVGLLLRKSLYGLKQAGRCWWLNIDSFLCSIGFVSCKSEPCVYNYESGGVIVLLVLYVDDLLMLSSCERKLKWVKEQLSDKYEMKDLGVVSKYVGYEFVREKGKTTLHQGSYIDSYCLNVTVATWVCVTRLH